MMVADREGKMARRDEAVQVEGENGAHVLRRRRSVPSAPVRASSTSSTRLWTGAPHTPHAPCPPLTPPRASGSQTRPSEGWVGAGGRGTRTRSQRARRAPPPIARTRPVSRQRPAGPRPPPRLLRQGTHAPARPDVAVEGGAAPRKRTSGVCQCHPAHRLPPAHPHPRHRRLRVQQTA